MELKTNFFYDSFYGDFKVKDLVDLYAIYFPQFHTIELNNKVYYKGYNDFENLKLLKNKNSSNHILTPNYEHYDLSNLDIVKNQIKIAKEYNFKGFGCYYYWFDNIEQDNMIMRKVVDNLFKVNDETFKIFFVWKNKRWSKQDLENYYLEKNFLKNIDNLLKYFKKMYLKENNKPVLTIHNPELFPKDALNTFFKLLDKKCKLDGFAGCTLILNNLNTTNDNFKKISIHPNTQKFYDKLNHNEYKINLDEGIETFFFQYDNSPRMVKPYQPIM